MKGQMLELLRPEATPQLVPAVDLQAAAKAQMRLQTATLDPAAKTQAVIVASAEPVRNDATEVRPLISETRAVEAVSKLDLPAPQVKELTWGRYAWAPTMAGDDYSKQFEFALLQGRQSLGATAPSHCCAPRPTAMSLPPSTAAPNSGWPLRRPRWFAQTICLTRRCKSAAAFWT